MTVRTFGKATTESIEHEALRLAALEELDLLDTPHDRGFDNIVQLITDVFCVEIGIVSLIDAHRQWYKSCNGLPWREVSREGSFCKHVVVREEPLVVQDASKDARFADHPAVTGDSHVRFYAGVPLVTAEGYVVGSVCAIGCAPRSFDQRDLQILQRLASVAMDRIDLLRAATTDSLTGLLNRRAFREEANELIEFALRHRQHLSCVALDIDHFKQVNDTYGHAAGDEVIKAVADACRRVMRGTDKMGRLGGEEFAIILPHADLQEAAVAAEKLRHAIDGTIVRGDFGEISVTASLGVSSLSLIGKDLDTVLAQADASLYRAKSSGRNRCVVWETPESAAAGARRRVLKAGSIIFNNQRSAMDCTVRSFGSHGAGLMVSSTIGVPAEFVLSIPADNFETLCHIVSQDTQNLEVAFR